MQRNHPDTALAELYRNFELVLEDYAFLKAEVQLLRREAREQHDLTMFLLRSLAIDLAGQRTDHSVHVGTRIKTQQRLAPRRTLSTRSGANQTSSR